MFVSTVRLILRTPKDRSPSDNGVFTSSTKDRPKIWTTGSPLSNTIRTMPQAKSAKDDGAEAADLEAFFSETFFLYDTWPLSTATATTCGCGVPRRTLVAWAADPVARRACPLCAAPHHKIQTVLDGHSHSLASNRRDDDVTAPTRPRLVFKHGNLVYLVGLSPQTKSTLFSTRGGRLGGWSSLFSSSSSSSSSSRRGDMLAQHCVARVLNLHLSEMKVRTRRWPSRKGGYSGLLCTCL
jgi:hypothetical protein